MKISELGELKLIQHFSKPFLQNTPKNTIGIGDDCAVIPHGQEQSLLVTTDMLVENVHFLKHVISPNDLGYKSLAVNISDIAAMGGKPTSAFLSLALPKNVEVKWLDDFFAGFYDLAQSLEVSLLGGDLTHSQQTIVINITLLGMIDNPFIKLRSAAKPLDLICVTESLGNSAAGLQAILQQTKNTESVKALIHHHHRPRPHAEEGAFLARQPGVHAMIDVSDGIASDLKQIMARSHCHAEIFVEKLPFSQPFIQACQQFAWEPISLALSGGEDYCLLVTIAPEDYPSVAQTYLQDFGKPLYLIGQIKAQTQEQQEPTLLYSLEGKLINPKLNTFEHFSPIQNF